MQQYITTGPKPSGVIGYEIEDTFIKVKFKKGTIYQYSYKSAGIEAVEEMKNLAMASRGLNTYISKNKPKFEI